MTKSLCAGLLSLALIAPMAPAYGRTHNTKVVDVNAHVVPPPPANAQHVVVINSAQHAKRHHGLAGAFQRLHQWHMRQRAKLYRSLNK